MLIFMNTSKKYENNSFREMFKKKNTRFIFRIFINYVIYLEIYK